MDNGTINEQSAVTETNGWGRRRRKVIRERGRAMEVGIIRGTI
jgi:hypothetical protein